MDSRERDRMEWICCFVFCPAVHIVVLEYIHLFIVSILVY